MDKGREDLDSSKPSLGVCERTVGLNNGGERRIVLQNSLSKTLPATRAHLTQRQLQQKETQLKSAIVRC